MSKVLHTIKDDVIETLLLVKVCFSSFWFWLPVLYGGYIVFQIWLLIMVHPLTILIVPGAISAYLIVQKDRRMKAQYGIDDKKPRSVLHPYSLMPTERASSSWDIEKALEEYKKMTKGNEENRG